MGAMKRHLIRRKANGNKPKAVSAFVPQALLSGIDGMSEEQLRNAIERIQNARTIHSRMGGVELSEESQDIILKAMRNIEGN